MAFAAAIALSGNAIMQMAPLPVLPMHAAAEAGQLFAKMMTAVQSSEYLQHADPVGNRHTDPTRVAPAASQSVKSLAQAASQHGPVAIPGSVSAIMATAAGAQGMLRSALKLAPAIAAASADAVTDNNEDTVMPVVQNHEGGLVYHGPRGPLNVAADVTTFPVDRLNRDLQKVAVAAWSANFMLWAADYCHLLSPDLQMTAAEQSLLTGMMEFCSTNNMMGCLMYLMHTCIKQGTATLSLPGIANPRNRSPLSSVTSSPVVGHQQRSSLRSSLADDSDEHEDDDDDDQHLTANTDDAHQQMPVCGYWVGQLLMRLMIPMCLIISGLRSIGVISQLMACGSVPNDHCMPVKTRPKHTKQPMSHTSANGHAKGDPSYVVFWLLIWGVIAFSGDSFVITGLPSMVAVVLTFLMGVVTCRLQQSQHQHLLQLQSSSAGYQWPKSIASSKTKVHPHSVDAAAITPTIWASQSLHTVPGSTVEGGDQGPALPSAQEPALCFEWMPVWVILCTLAWEGTAAAAKSGLTAYEQDCWQSCVLLMLQMTAVPACKKVGCYWLQPHACNYTYPAAVYVACVTGLHAHKGKPCLHVL